MLRPFGKVNTPVGPDALRQEGMYAMHDALKNHFVPLRVNEDGVFRNEGEGWESFEFEKVVPTSSYFRIDDLPEGTYLKMAPRDQDKLGGADENKRILDMWEPEQFGRMVRQRTLVNIQAEVEEEEDMAANISRVIGGVRTLHLHYIDLLSSGTVCATETNTVASSKRHLMHVGGLFLRFRSKMASACASSIHASTTSCRDRT